jgi:hypothetical protein
MCYGVLAAVADSSDMRFHGIGQIGDAAIKPGPNGGPIATIKKKSR